MKPNDQVYRWMTPCPQTIHADATLFDAFAGLDFRKWMVEGFVTNLFDKRIDLSRQTACGSCTRALVTPGRPRTIGLRAGYKF